MEEIEISNWQEYQDLTISLDGWAFRGQREAKWPLISSLSRYLLSFVPDKSLWREREERSIRIFHRKAHHYISDPSILNDDLRCLTLMQHHGGVTRLIDFTKSPFVAAFFALEKAQSPSSVFALNTPALWSAVPTSEPLLTREAINPRIKSNLDKYFYENKHNVLWIGEPSQMDQRLVAQSGTFVMPGTIDNPIENILDHYQGKNNLIKKDHLAREIT